VFEHYIGTILARPVCCADKYRGVDAAGSRERELIFLSVPGKEPNLQLALKYGDRCLFTSE
jgi:hypothetical protein